MSVTKQGKRLRKEEEEAIDAKREELKEEGALRKAAVKSQTRPGRDKPH